MVDAVERSPSFDFGVLCPVPLIACAFRWSCEGNPNVCSEPKTYQRFTGYLPPNRRLDRPELGTLAGGLIREPTGLAPPLVRVPFVPSAIKSITPFGELNQRLAGAMI